MARKAPTLATLRALFARSGNQCAYPGCTHVLVDEDDLFVANVCHIEAAEPNGPRYNPDQSDDERRSADNLVLLCYAHHKRTDDVDRFPVDFLQDMKQKHEVACRVEPYAATDAVLESVSEEMDQYWSDIAKASRVETETRPFPMAIDAMSIDQILSEVKTSHNFLRDLLEAIEHQGAKACWDGYYIGAPNHFTRLQVLFTQLRVRHLEALCAASPEADGVRAQLEVAKKELRKLAESACHVD